MSLTISGDSPNFSAATVTTLTAPTSTITTLNAPSGVLATQNGMTGIAKAWVSFSGATPTINGTPFNVSSVTRTTTGTYVVNFTTAMPNTNYVTTATALRNTGVQSCFASVGPSGTSSIATGSVGICTLNDATTFADSAYVGVAVFSS